MIALLILIRYFSTAPTKCSNCPSTLAELWCNDCWKSFCTKCCNDIHTLLAFKDHQRKPITQRPSEPRFCDMHRTEQLRYWCSCEKLICLECRLSDQHKTHKPMSLDEAGNDITVQVCIPIFLF